MNTTVNMTPDHYDKGDYHESGEKSGQPPPLKIGARWTPVNLLAMAGEVRVDHKRRALRLRGTEPGEARQQGMFERAWDGNAERNALVEVG